MWEKDCERLAGVRTEAKVSLLIEGNIFMEEEGEVQFAPYGLSGIPVFQLSRYVSRALEDGKTCEIRLDILPSYTQEQIEEALRKKQRQIGRASCRERV